MKKLGLVILLVVAVTLSVFLLRDNPERLLANHIGEPYDVISVTEGEDFSTYLVQVGDDMKQFIIDHDSKTVKAYNMLDETFRQCLDND